LKAPPLSLTAQALDLPGHRIDAPAELLRPRDSRLQVDDCITLPWRSHIRVPPDIRDTDLQK